MSKKVLTVSVAAALTCLVWRRLKSDRPNGMLLGRIEDSIIAVIRTYLELKRPRTLTL